MISTSLTLRRGCVPLRLTVLLPTKPKEALMTNTAMSTPFAEGDFRVGRVISQSASVLTGNFPTLFLIGVIAYLPIQLAALWFTGLAAGGALPAGTSPAQIGIAAFLFLFVMIVFSLFAQAVILHAAFQHMRNQPANIFESLKVGLRRFFPLLLLGIVMGLLMVLVFAALSMAAGIVVVISGNTVYTIVATILAVVLGFATVAILYTMWFVAVAACVVERRGPFASMGRSRQLTKEHRWRIFGLLLLLFFVSTVVSVLIELVLRPAAGTILTFLVTLAWTAIWGAYYAVSVAVSYHDLRVAKEGVDIEQIVAVFD